MAKYRKLPVIIDAEVYRDGLEDGFAVIHDSECFSESEPAVIPRNIHTDLEYTTVNFPRADLIVVAQNDPEFLDTLQPFIKTLEGLHFITAGDWIITGIKGERYSCKPDIFEATYEPVD